MLSRLSIRDVVLIDRLDMTFYDKLGVLTGETGAGKSILLDSLGLALGDRADSGKIRAGADQLSVAAEFDIPRTHPAWEILREADLPVDNDTLILRRTVSRDGRSRAYVNDQSVSVSLLRTLGDTLVEVHGQFDSHGMMNPATHLPILDAYGGTEVSLISCRKAYNAWNAAQASLRQAQDDLARARAEEENLRHQAEELCGLDPKIGEEEDLAERRALLMNGEKLAEGLNAALHAIEGDSGGVEAALQAAQRAIERVATLAPGSLDGVIDALDRATVEAAEAHNQLERAASDIDLDPQALERVEERLFALRALARKHGVDCDALPALLETLQRQLKALDDGGQDIKALEQAAEKARVTYTTAAQKLSKARQNAAKTLDQAVCKELPPLKLDKARFITEIEPLPESQWGPSGMDKVAFLVATNPGSQPGPLGKIASGGELSRFMLSLKVALAAVSPVPTLIFDEVDAGIGGATAAAVGERLGALSDRLQVLVVTHSPQVAAKGHHHWRVAKSVHKGTTSTTIIPLTLDERREEIARMLAGETVTQEARAAALSLLS